MTIKNATLGFAETLLALAALGLGGCATGAEDTSPDESVTAGEQAVQQPVSATISLTSSWADGYCANVQVTNKGTAKLRAWTIIIGINPAGISTIWNAEPSIVGVPEYKQLVAQSKDYNAALEPNASTDFGFCGLGPANGVPSIIGAMGFD